MMSMSGHTTEKVFRKYFSTTSKELGEEGSKLFSYDLIEEIDRQLLSLIQKTPLKPKLKIERIEGLVWTGVDSKRDLSR